MATNTYVPLYTTTLVSTATSVTIPSIPSTYTDLVIVSSLANNGLDSLYFRVNGDTGSNYSTTWMSGNGTTASSSRQSNTGNGILAGAPVVGMSSTNYGVSVIQIMNYSNSTTYKTALCRWSLGSAETNATVGWWRSTSAITSVTIFPGGNTFSVGSTFSLYGIAAEPIPAGAKATGGEIFSDATYMYHAFGASGIFAPTQSISADVLVVAGGGGGGDVGGGGGAGGYRTSTLSLTATNYTVTIGGGGAGSVGRATATSGSNSVFSSITSSGGGGGGGITANGLSGGSGGGGGGGGANTAGSGNSGAYSPVEGFAGGNGGTSTWASGGGGGASAVGTVPSPTDGSVTGGNGGNGLYTAISGGSATGLGQLSGGNYYFAGGGAGAGWGGINPGTPGLGGGGRARDFYNGNTKGSPGLPNTGGGGGGAYNTGGATVNPGGSGIVIVRYVK